MYYIDNNNCNNKFSNTKKPICNDNIGNKDKNECKQNCANFIFGAT